MQKTRSVKVVTSTITSEIELEQLVADYASKTHQLHELEARMNQEIDAIRTRYLADIDRLTAQLEAGLNEASAWASLHPERFQAKKSIDLVHGTIGFRTGTPRCVLRRGTDMDDLVNRMLGDPDASPFVRQKYELAKDRIIDASAATPDVVQTVLNRYGIKVTQSERFYIDVKTDESPEK